jgi:hypothetical protein
MKKVLMFLLFAGFATAVSAQTYYPYNSTSTNTEVRYQKGYYKSDGTYVQGHYKTVQTPTNTDNFSTTPNYNIYTQEKGTRARDYSPDAYNYGQGRTIYTGERGGQYYYNDKGNKVYVPKRN